MDERCEITKHHDLWSYGEGTGWYDFKEDRPEDSSLCVVEYVDYLIDDWEEVYDYEVRLFENRERCINNWHDVKRWKYLHED